MGGLAHSDDAKWRKDAATLPESGSVDGTSREDTSQPQWLRVAFEREEAAYDASLAVWAALLLALTVLGVGSAFMALVWSAVPLAARTLARRVEIASFAIGRRVHAQATSAGVVPRAAAGASLDAPKGWLFLSAYLAGLILPLVVHLQGFMVFFSFFVPLMGRSGTHVPSDVLIAALFGTLMGVAALMGLSVVLLLSNWAKVRNSLLGVLVGSLLFAASPAGFAFSEATPKRLYMVHVARHFHAPAQDSFGDVSHILEASAPASASASPAASTTATAAAAAALATASAAGSTLSEGASIRAARSAMRASMPTTDTALWLISMDFQNMAPLRHVRVPAALMGVAVPPKPAAAAPAAAVGGAAAPAADDDDGLVSLFSLGQVQQCSSNETDTRARLFCDLPYYLPLPPFVQGNMLFGLPESLAPPASLLRPLLSLARVEVLPEPYPSVYTRRRRLHFEVTNGASHMTLYLNHRSGLSRVQAWSFGSSAADSALLGRPTLGTMYQQRPSGHPRELFVYFASGMPVQLGTTDQTQAKLNDAADLLLHAVPAASYSSFASLPRSWSFWLEVADALEDLGGSGTAASDEAPFLDLALASHHLSAERNAFTHSLLPFFPNWLSAVCFTSFHESFRF